jgi:DNA-binding transcriptional ArsR family regulator
MISPTLQQEISELEADFCSALSDPTRLLILYALNEEARNVTELTTELGLPQPTVSRHLKVLRDRQLQAAERRLIQAINLVSRSALNRGG